MQKTLITTQGGKHMRTNFKRVIISVMAILAICTSVTGCGNVQTADKEVTTTTALVTSTPTVTTTVLETNLIDNIDWNVTTTEGQSFAVTSEETIIYTESNIESEQITTLPQETQLIVEENGEKNDFTKVTTTTGKTGYVQSSMLGINTENATTLPVVTTAPKNTSTPATTTVTTTTPKVTTTVTTSKKTTTTTTTTKKNTTTTTIKKQNTNNSSSNNSSSKGTTMWVKLYNIWQCSVYEVNGSSWKGISDTYVPLGEKVTAYETVEIKSAGLTLRKCKLSDGSVYYINVDDLCSSDPRATTYLTQSMVDKLVKELQEYSNELYFKTVKLKIIADIEENKNKLPDGYCWESYQKEIIDAVSDTVSSFSPSNNGWYFPNYYDTCNGKNTYDYVLKSMKNLIDEAFYARGRDNIVAISAVYYKNGWEWNGRSYSTEPCYVFYPIC